MKPARTADDRSVRVTEHDPSAHRGELVGEEEPVLEHLLEDKHSAGRLCRNRERDAGEVRRERGPGPVVDLGDRVADVVPDAQALLGRHDQVIAVVVRLEAEPLEHHADHLEVLWNGVGDAQLAARDRRQGHEARDLDVVRGDRVARAAEACLPVHGEHVRPDAVDPGAHRDQEPRQVLYVGLRGGVANRGRARREGGRHERVLRPHHAGLVHEEVACAQAVRRVHLVAAVDFHPGPQRAQRVQVRVEPPPADEVPAGRGHVCLADAGEQRAGEQERGADAARELGFDVAPDRVGPQRQLVLVTPGHAHAEILEQRQHRVDVADPRHVADHELFLGEDRCGQDREGGVLVPRRDDRPGQRVPALDHELFHRAGALCWRRRHRARVRPSASDREPVH